MLILYNRETNFLCCTAKDVTFVPLPDMWFPSFFAFESVSKPSYFIRLLPEKELVLDKYDGTKDFKKDASFSLSRKPDASKPEFTFHKFNGINTKLMIFK